MIKNFATLFRSRGLVLRQATSLLDFSPALQRTLGSNAPLQQQDDKQQQQSKHTAPTADANKEEQEHSNNNNGTDEKASTTASNESEVPNMNSSSSTKQTENMSTMSRQLLQQHVEQLQKLKASTTVMKQTMTDGLAPWQKLLYKPLGGWIQDWMAGFMRTRIETDFNLNDTLEGALDAFWTFHTLVNNEDFETLKTCVSTKVLDAVKKTAEEYRANGLIWRSEVDPDSLEAQLRGVGFWSKEQIAAYDKEQAELSTTSTTETMRKFPSGAWVILSIQLTAKQQVTITREEDGIVVAELTDMRSTKWKFANGPLPDDLPTRQLESPWWLVSL